jgi:hypothetical protein
LADLLHRHGKDVSEGKVVLADDANTRLAGVLNHWIEVLLNSPEANRHQMSDIVWALHRFGQAQFVSALKQMLERDLADRARAKEEYTKSGRRGPLSPDVTHSYTNLYQGAFAAIGGDEVVKLMMQYLPSPRFGVEAAQVLATLWNRAHPSAKEKRFFGWHDFSEVKAQRLQRGQPGCAPPTCEYAEAIFAVVRGIIANPVSDTARRHAIALAQIALGIPHGSKRAELDQLLQFSLPYSSKLSLLAAAAVAGETIPAALLLAGAAELVEAAKKEPWRLDQNRGELMGWIELFAFADRPTAVHDALGLVPGTHRNPWKLERLLNALGNSPHEDALRVLEELAKRDTRFLARHEWLNAMMKLGTEASAFALLDHVCHGTLGGQPGGIDAWHMSQHIESLALKFPSFRDELLRRYEVMSAGSQKQILERALAEIADVRIILLMVASHAATSRSFDGGLVEAIRNVAIGRKPVADWPGAFQEFSVSLKALRKRLFELVLAGGREAALAEPCLNYIEELRDEHGRIDDEPRHPDIRSGCAWPKDTQSAS